MVPAWCPCSVLSARCAERGLGVLDRRRRGPRGGSLGRGCASSESCAPRAPSATRPFPADEGVAPTCKTQIASGRPTSASLSRARVFWSTTKCAKYND